MSAVKPPAKVLVTGANGFIAAWIVHTLLERGFSVRGTVREHSKSTYLRNHFKDEVEKGKLEFVVIPDMMTPGAFDEAVKGVDAIVHAASPVHLKADDPEEMIQPAVKGTVGILKSASKHAGPQLKRVIYVSSSAAVINTPFTGKFDETSWNEGSIIEVQDKGRAADQMSKYRASKSLAERAAWDFINQNRSSLTFDLVTTCPTYVFGPVLSHASSPPELGASMFMFYEGVFSKATSLEYRASYQSEWSDVRDVAEAHLRALAIPEAGGRRFLLSKEPYNWLDWCDTVNELKIPGIEIPFGTYSAAGDLPYRLRFDTTAVRTVLDLTSRYTRYDTAKDIIDDFRARGFFA